MKQFAIECTIKWTKKDGSLAEMKSYFRDISGYPLQLKHMADIKECKKYSSRAAALIDWRKYFRFDKTAKIKQLN